MGAGITLAQGIGRVEPHTINFAFIGDSTFFHTGIAGIINAVYNHAEIIVVVLDNYTTAMTGNQPHPGTGKNARGDEAERISIPGLLAALGLKTIVRADPFDILSAEEAVKQVLEGKGVRALVFEGPCIVGSGGKAPLVVDGPRCTGCGICVKKLGCPAISFEPPPVSKTSIDPALCTGCGVCKNICPAAAIAGGTP
jgi:indolepyruvate ferredoxin oxidoreductase alpha subunit